MKLITSGWWPLSSNEVAQIVSRETIMNKKGGTAINIVPLQDEKLKLVDEVAEMDKEYRAAKTKGDGLRADRNRLSKEIGGLMKQGLRDKAEEVKQQVKDMGREQ